MPINLTDNLDEGEKRKPSFTPGKAAVQADQAVTRAALNKAVDAGAPPVPFEPRCHVCTSPHRKFIEAQLVQGTLSYVWIADNVPGNEGGKIDRRSVSNHAKRHMNYADHAIRAILEAEADQAAQNYEEGVRGVITHRGVLEVALRRAYQDIVDGVTTVEPRDLIAIINTVQKMDDQAEAVAVNQLRAQVQAFIQAIKVETDQETWSRIFTRFKGMMADEGMAIEAGSVDGTVVG